MTSIVVVKRSISGWQDKRARVSPGGVSCNTLIFASLCRWTNMSNPSFVQLKFPREYLSNTKEISDGMLTNVKGVNVGLGWLTSTARPDMAAPHSIIPSGYDRRSTQLISEVNAAVELCHAVPITITIWPIPFADLRWTTFTDSGFDTGGRQRHQQGWLVCATNTFQPRTVGAGECATLAKSKAHTKSRKSTVGRNLCSKLSSGGDDMDQSIVGIDDLERF